MRWLEVQGVHKSRMYVRLHLYADMDIQKETNYWSATLGIPTAAFRKPYIKKSFFNKRRNYKGRFGHGTCNLLFNNRDLYELIMMSIKYLGGQYGVNGFLAMRKV